MGIYILVGVIGGIWAAAVASTKHNNAMAWGLLGFLCPLIGVIAAYVASPTERPMLGPKEVR